MKIKALTTIVDNDGSRVVVINAGKTDTVSDEFGEKMIAAGKAAKVAGKAAKVEDDAGEEGAPV